MHSQTPRQKFTALLMIIAKQDIENLRQFEIAKITHTMNKMTLDELMDVIITGVKPTTHDSKFMAYTLYRSDEEQASSYIDQFAAFMETYKK